MSASVDDDDDVPPLPLWKRTYARVIGAGVLGMLVFLLIRGNPAPKPPAPEKTAQDFIGDVVPYQPIVPDTPAPVVHVAPPPPVRPTPPRAVVPARTAPITLPAAPSLPAPQRLLRLPTAIAAAPDELPMMTYAVHVAAPAVASAAPPQTTLAFKAATITGAKASPAMDTSRMLMPGVLFAVLDTAIDSDEPGPIVAHLPYPVYSDKGVVLMAAGTRIIGNYQSIQSGGQTRLKAASLYAITPDGVFVPLGGPLADGLGRAGLTGTIDQRYLQRFGAATLMMLTESALNIAQSSMQKGGNSYLNFNSGGSGISSLADEILRQQINIPPLFHANQGSLIGIWVTEPIDFSGSYKPHTEGTAQ